MIIEQAQRVDLRQYVPDTMSDATFQREHAGLAEQHHFPDLERTVLPTDAPEQIVQFPTLNRWGTTDKPGSLPRALYTAAERISEDGLAPNTWLVLADSSNGENVDARRRWLAEFKQIPDLPRIFLMTPETQHEVADTVQQRTGIRRKIIDAILTNTGYASQRVKGDIVAAGLALQSGRLKVLSLDDDTAISRETAVIIPDKLPEGMQPKPNSQVILPDHLVDSMTHLQNHNKISPFFTHLGKTVAQVRESNPNLSVTKTWNDDMHTKLEEAAGGEIVQFEVNPDLSQPLLGAEHATVIAAAATKSDVPDYRTVRIANAALHGEFADREVAVRSFPSGINTLFAFLSCNTNVDSAALSRHFDEKTAMMPWWYVSDLDISKGNPLQTVTAHYRADNELLPVLLEVTQQVTGELYVYLAGIDTRVTHHRARSGYRPNIVEQAAASLVGNIAAMEAARRIEVIDGRIGVNTQDFGRTAEARRIHIQKVYEEMHTLAYVCEDKIGELRDRQQTTSNQEAVDVIKDKIRQYEATYETLKGKLAGFNEQAFIAHIDQEIQGQVRFYAEVLDATPTVIMEVQKMIQRGEYPVYTYPTQGK